MLLNECNPIMSNLGTDHVPQKQWVITKYVCEMIENISYANGIKRVLNMLQS